MNKLCQLYIDDKQYEFQVEGEFFWGEDKLLYNEVDNVISKMPWKHDGYAVVNIFEKEEFQKLRKSIEKNILKALKLQEIVYDEDNFILENYHKIVFRLVRYLMLIAVCFRLLAFYIFFVVNI